MANFKLADFVRPDGTLDTDAWLTSKMNNEDRNRIRQEMGYTFNPEGQNDTEKWIGPQRDKLETNLRSAAGLGSHGPAVTARSAGPGKAAMAFADAPRVDIAGLANGSSATPDTAALERLKNPEPPKYDETPRRILEENDKDIERWNASPTAPWNKPGAGYSSDAFDLDQLPPGLLSDQERETLKKVSPSVARQFIAQRTHKREVAGLAKARSAADEAVRGAEQMGVQSRNDLALQKDDDLVAERKNAPVIPSTVTWEKPKQALAKYQAKKLATGSGGLSPSPGRPEFAKDFVSMAQEQENPPGKPSPRQPLMAAQQMLTGAKPDTSADEAEMADAQKSRDDMLMAAQIASQFGHYADVVQGTETGDRGAGLRGIAGNKLEDLKAKRGLRQQALEQAQADEDRAFNREGVVQQRQDAATKRQNEAAYNDGTSELSRRRRAIAVSMYPDVVKKVPPAVWNSMSAADIDTFLKEAQPVKVAGIKGAGGVAGEKPMKPGEMNALRRGLPPEAANLYNEINSAKREIAAMGGWKKVKSGLLGSMTPTMFMDPQNQKVRQTIGRVVSAFLSSRGGKAITDTEQKIILGKIAADPTSFGVTPDMLERGITIVENAVRDNLLQSMAGAPDSGKQAIYNDLPEGMRDWAESRKAQPVQPQNRLIVRNPKTGERRYFNPATQQLEEAVP